MYSTRQHANQYRQTGVSSAVLDADPHKLIALMLAGARERARLAIACAIIGGLNGALNMEAGGEIANGLHSLYDYAQRRLLDANAGNEAAPLHEVDTLLADIESAWIAITPGGAPAPAGVAP